MQPLRALLLGLGSSQVAAFGTLPDLDALKDFKIATKGESAGETMALKLDANFCTEAINKLNIGSAQCNTITDKDTCGGGSDTYRRSSSKPNFYDVCQWICSSDDKCQCKMAGWTYECGTKCFPQDAYSTDEPPATPSVAAPTSACAAGEKEVTCGTAPNALTECVLESLTTKCETVTKWVIAANGGLEKVSELKLTKSVARRGRRELQESCGSGGLTCKGVTSETPISDTIVKVVDNQCKCTVTSGCSCVDSTSIKFIEATASSTTDVAYDADDTCVDVAATHFCAVAKPPDWCNCVDYDVYDLASWRTQTNPGNPGGGPWCGGDTVTSAVCDTKYWVGDDGKPRACVHTEGRCTFTGNDIVKVRNPNCV